MTRTNDTEDDRIVEPTTEHDAPRPPRPRDPWERQDTEQPNLDTTQITDPPDPGVDYYRQMIDLGTCLYTYQKSGDMRRFTWHGELQDIDEFRTALYQLYNAAYDSDLEKAEFRPKAFFSFAGTAVPIELKETLHQKLTEGRSDSNTPPGYVEPIHKRIGYLMARSAALGCEHRTQIGRRRKSQDTVLKSVLPEAAQSD